MIDALIQGKLHAKAQQRTGKAGRPFVTAKVTTTAKDGNAQFVNVIAFAPDACNALLALGAGDAVALAGELASSIYTGKDGAPRVGLDLTAHAVLTAYHVTRKRRAVQPQGQPQDSAPPPPEPWLPTVPVGALQECCDTWVSKTKVGVFRPLKFCN